MGGGEEGAEVEGGAGELSAGDEEGVAVGEGEVRRADIDGDEGAAETL